jgi:hypothetical protein
VRLWLAVLVGLTGGALLGGIAWKLAYADVNKEGDWYGGAATFIGSAGALGVFIGYAAVARKKLARDGFTLTYASIGPKPDGYRELATLRVADLLAALRAAGYAPSAEVCDEVGQRRGPLDETTALADASFAIVDRDVRGWIRIELHARGGLVEIWSERGDSAEELALFALRALDRLVGSMRAARETSSLAPDPVSTLTSALGERPMHRR